MAWKIYSFNFNFFEILKLSWTLKYSYRCCKTFTIRPLAVEESNENFEIYVVQTFPFAHDCSWWPWLSIDDILAVIVWNFNADVVCCTEFRWLCKVDIEDCEKFHIFLDVCWRRWFQVGNLIDTDGLCLRWNVDFNKQDFSTVNFFDFPPRHDFFLSSSSSAMKFCLSLHFVVT